MAERAVRPPPPQRRPPAAAPLHRPPVGEVARDLIDRLTAHGYDAVAIVSLATALLGEVAQNVAAAHARRGSTGGTGAR